MLKILVRLYLVIIVAYAGALLFIPDTIVGLFRDRFMAYNLDQAKGVQALIVRQFRQAPREQWPAVESKNWPVISRRWNCNCCAWTRPA